jgi:hypothetical protein
VSDFLAACWALRYLLAGICVVAYVVACIDAYAADRRHARATEARARRTANTQRLQQHTTTAFDAAMHGGDDFAMWRKEMKR